jgi:hypothetical protein
MYCWRNVRRLTFLKKWITLTYFFLCNTYWFLITYDFDVFQYVIKISLTFASLEINTCPLFQRTHVIFIIIVVNFIDADI